MEGRIRWPVGSCPRRIGDPDREEVGCLSSATGPKEELRGTEQMPGAQVATARLCRPPIRGQWSRCGWPWSTDQSRRCGQISVLCTHRYRSSAPSFAHRALTLRESNLRYHAEALIASHKGYVKTAGPALPGHARADGPAVVHQPARKAPAFVLRRPHRSQTRLPSLGDAVIALGCPGGMALDTIDHAFRLLRDPKNTRLHMSEPAFIKAWQPAQRASLVALQTPPSTPSGNSAPGYAPPLATSP